MGHNLASSEYDGTRYLKQKPVEPWEAKRDFWFVTIHSETFPSCRGEARIKAEERTFGFSDVFIF